MKMFITVLVLAFVSTQANYASESLLKLKDILKAMDLTDIVEGPAAHKIGASFFKFYSEDLLPLQFTLWKEHVGRQYEDQDEHEYRLDVWAKNVKMINEHNQQNQSYSMAMNHFGDMTNEEYRSTMLGMNLKTQIPVGLAEPRMFGLPSSVDWRKKGYVTPVKNQGQCGSCWSFSSTGALEGAYKKKSGKLVSLSEQNLVDCSGSYGNYGCNGGLMDNAFQYVIDNGGIDTEAGYPYEGVEGECRFSNTTEAPLKVAQFVDVQAGSEPALKIALAQNSPVSIAIDASQSSFQFYNSGVYVEPLCSSTQLDHGVLAVGYGTDESGQDFWIVKNSWSEQWGVDGYIMMARNQGNQCGVASAASYPLAG